MASASRAQRQTGPKEGLYNWEGKDKAGKLIRGETRANGDAMVRAMLRRQGILVTPGGFIRCIGKICFKKKYLQQYMD